MVGVETCGHGRIIISPLTGNNRWTWDDDGSHVSDYPMRDLTYLTGPRLSESHKMKDLLQIMPYPWSPTVNGQADNVKISHHNPLKLPHPTLRLVCDVLQSG